MTKDAPASDLDDSDEKADDEVATAVDDDTDAAAKAADDGTDAAAADAEDAGGATSTPDANRARPGAAFYLLAALLAVVLAQLVMTWFVLSTTTQVRDQAMSAATLQKCLIVAGLAQNPATDPTGTIYAAAVKGCVGK